MRRKETEKKNNVRCERQNGGEGVEKRKSERRSELRQKPNHCPPPANICKCNRRTVHISFFLPFLEVRLRCRILPEQVFVRLCNYQVHNKYTSEDFDEDLRSVLRRSGCKNEKVAFILDESNVLESGFLERMNTLLANGEVPGLFESKLLEIPAANSRIRCKFL